MTRIKFVIVLVVFSSLSAVAGAVVPRYVVGYGSPLHSAATPPTVEIERVCVRSDQHISVKLNLRLPSGGVIERQILVPPDVKKSVFDDRNVKLAIPATERAVLVNGERVLLDAVNQTVKSAAARGELNVR